MYAITFDLETAAQRCASPDEWRANAYAAISKVLVEEFGFAWMQGAAYFGGAAVTPVTCVLAVQELAARFDWFAPAVRDIRMLRIEENNDLMPALKKWLPPA